MFLLISQPRVGISYNEILALHFAARELGWEVLPAPTSWRLDHSVKGKGIPYGSQLFCEVIAQQMNWTLHLNPFDWLAKLPIEYTKRQVDFMTLKQARKIFVPKFVKPADDKCFTAKIYQPEQVDVPEVVPEETPCLVSEIVRFEAEYRCFVRNNKVVTSSCYIYEGEVAEPKNWYKYNLTKQHPEDFVNKMLETVDTVDTVIDVGVLSTGSLAIIESNPVWASGLYGCDPLECLKTMESTVTYER